MSSPTLLSLLLNNSIHDAAHMLHRMACSDSGRGALQMNLNNALRAVGGEKGPAAVLAMIDELRKVRGWREHRDYISAVMIHSIKQLLAENEDSGWGDAPEMVDDLGGGWSGNSSSQPPPSLPIETHYVSYECSNAMMEHASDWMDAHSVPPTLFYRILAAYGMASQLKPEPLCVRLRRWISENKDIQIMRLVDFAVHFNLIHSEESLPPNTDTFLSLREILPPLLTRRSLRKVMINHCVKAVQNTVGASEPRPGADEAYLVRLAMSFGHTADAGRLVLKLGLDPANFSEVREAQMDVAIRWLIHEAGSEVDAWMKSDGGDLDIWRSLVESDMPHVIALVDTVSGYPRLVAYASAQLIQLSARSSPAIWNALADFTKQQWARDPPPVLTHSPWLQPGVTSPYLSIADTSVTSIVIVDTPAKLAESLEALLLADAVGLDTEWRASHSTMDSTSVSIMQLGARDRAWIWDLVRLDTGLWISALRRLMMCADVLKLGFAWDGDMRELQRSYPSDGWWSDSPVNFADLQHVPLEETASKKKYSLATLVSRVLGRCLRKQPQLTNWDRRPLTAAQIDYAALDAVVLVLVYESLDEDAREHTKCGGPVHAKKEKKRKERRPKKPAPTSPMPTSEPTFIVDTTLSRLSRKLRCLGFDVVYVSTHDPVNHGRADPAKYAELIAAAAQEDRRFLTRDRAWAGPFYEPDGTIVTPYVVEAAHAPEQLHEVMAAFHLVQDDERVFTRCVLCNESPLSTVDKAGLLAAYRGEEDEVIWGVEVKVLRLIDSPLWQCGACSHVFWKGSHYDSVIASLDL